MQIYISLNNQADLTKEFFASVPNDLTPFTVEGIVYMHNSMYIDLTEGKAYDVVETIDVELEGGDPVVAYKVIDDEGDEVIVPSFLAIAL